MATRRARDRDRADQDVAEQPPPVDVSAFARLCSSAAMVMSFKPGSLGAASADQKASFDLLCAPDAMLGIALLEASSVHAMLAAREGQSRQRNHRVDARGEHWMWDFASKDGVFASMFRGWGDAQWGVFARAVGELADDVERAAESDAFLASAKEGSRMIARPGGPEQLNYPALGMALSGSATMVGGKRSKTLGGFALPTAGPVDSAALAARPTPYQPREGRPQAIDSKDAESQSVAAWGAQRAGMFEHEAAELDAALAQVGAHPAAYVSHDAVSGSFEKYVSGGEVEGAADLGGEMPLPNARLIRAQAEPALADAKFSSLMLSEAPKEVDAKSYQNNATRKEMKALVAAKRFAAPTYAAWGKALGAALGDARPSSRPLHEFSASIPSLSELSGRPWGIQSASGLGDLLNRRQYEESVVSNQGSARALKEFQTLWRASIEARDARESRVERHWRNNAQNWAADMAQGLACAPPGGRKRGSALIQAALGVDAKALGDKFSARAPRLGLLQAACLMRSAWGLSESLDADAQENLREGEAPAVRPPRDGPHLVALPALARLDAALFKARSAFAAGAFDEAARVEQAWMDQAGFGAPWRQALAMGEPSSRAIAWSAKNPMSEAIASSDPMERLAGGSSRALGLSSKLGPGRVVADYKEALAARGASPEGLDLLAASEGAREVFDRLARGMGLPQKALAYASGQALSFACHALTACAAEGLLPKQCALLLASHADVLRGADAPDSLVDAAGNAGHWAHRETPLLPLYLAGFGSGSDAAFDGFGPVLGQVTLSTLDAARELRALGAAKSEKYQAFVRALAADWAQTLGEGARLGLADEASLALARSRASEIRSAMPTAPSLDWRAEWNGAHAWRMFGIPSPRLSAALADADSRGGELGAWAAARARRFGILDARDGNDVVAQARGRVKAATGMSDAAWKMAINGQGALILVDKAMEASLVEAAPRFSGPFLGQSLSESLSAKGSQLARERTDDVAGHDPAPLMGLAFTAAAANGIAPQDAADAARALTESRRLANLFGMQIQPQLVHGGAGAEFFCQESEAKRSRLPKLFVEACRRLQKLRADAAKPPEPPRGGAEPAERVEPARALSDEIGDLVDWVSGSEPGLWDQLPKEPTWGQMRRLSKSWHDEQALVAMEKASRMKLSQELAEAQFDAAAGSNPFSVKNASRWARILGSHASEGWEAVELLSSADLTMEGGAMHHCVSSYSGVCRKGASRMFSIRLNGERVSTLQVDGATALSCIDPSNVFKIAQNKGPYNKAPTKQCREFCEEVLSKVQAAWPKQVGAIARRLEERRAELAALALERKAGIVALAPARAKRAKAG